ncbi:hypothetical protein M408DRAFT_72095 [Serendipita vermifera MAFF 305830]|uniref:Major facilitator superfamily (MFS) profile domain-containing protein n=1 Tax=Serendipita vermifera MAFF 305830 TaxID=933852 RepID=A0A0C2XD41_SERVB|nr:hypothetical protein M408DRAFT_72095 [Serendipita vermifera MAFF 305830]
MDRKLQKTISKQDTATVLERQDPSTDESNPTSDLASASTARKLALLTIFSLAEFLDVFNNSALFPAIPVISSDLRFEPPETVWIISAYQLTFAAFLLLSGRISDVYTAKPAFIAGAFILGITHLIGGFTHHKIALLVLRALGGIGGALTIPSSLSLIVQLFPNPLHQARALGIFNGVGAIGNILGLILGAIIVQYAGWSWIFWFVAIVGVAVSAISLFLIPASKRERKRVNFDVVGVSLLTVAVILFIFAVTSGSTVGWGTAYVLAPLLISLALAAGFLFWEARINPDDAVLPPKMWKYDNFGILVSLALLPYFWWLTSFINLTSWWEQVYGWSPITTAVHFLAMGISGGLTTNITGYLPRWFTHKQIIITGLFMGIVASILLPFATGPWTYWPFVFPAQILGGAGLILVFVNSSIALFSYTPPSVAGTVGAVFNCALQLGSAVGLAAVASITTSLDSQYSFNPPITEWSRNLDHITPSMWKEAYTGRAASYWFALGILTVATLAAIVFLKVDKKETRKEESVEK